MMQVDADDRELDPDVEQIARWVQTTTSDLASTLADRGARGQRSACRMNVATATGLAMNAVCEPSMLSVVAPIR
jgi:hypothetical protein